MKIYYLTLKQKSGLLTELQSDTIYGHFCWRFKEKFNEKKLEEFISAYQKDSPVFTLSDGLLKIGEEIHFPRPYIFSKPEIREKKEDKILEFVKQKENKERNYINLSELNKFLLTGQIKFEQKSVEPSVKKHSKHIPALSESLRVSVQIDRNSFGSKEGRLFSYNPKYTKEDVSYVILVKVVNEVFFKEFNCEKILKEIFEIGFGKKKSSGYGQFEIVGNKLQEYVKIEESKESNGFIVLGNYLPSAKDNISPIGYDINTKYGRFGEELSQSENPFKNPIVFLTAGSCFKTENRKDYYGRVTNDSEISQTNPFAVQFGIPFILNFKYMENNI